MAKSNQQFADHLRATFGERLRSITLDRNEVSVEVAPDDLVEIATALRDESDFAFAQLIDVCGVDYSQYGQDEWETEEASSSGFGRGVDNEADGGRLRFGDELESHVPPGRRFAAVYHLLSYRHNRRMRLKVFAADDAFPVVPTVIDVWKSADWFEREAFDLFGILFSGHPDLRRILTDYGFVGHPFRKDFPLIGHVEMRYDPERERVVYEPVTIEPRVLVPRVRREDHRYSIDLDDAPDEEAADNA